MDPTDTIYSYIASQCCRTHEELTAENPLGFVTISREAGAGGLTIGEKLAKQLNQELPMSCPWTVFDKTFVEEILRDHHLPQRIAPFLKEAPIPEVEDILQDLFGLRPSQFTLVKRTNETILRLAKLGRVIIVGRGASILTAHIPGGVHVRLVAPLKKRIGHIQAYFEMTEKEANIFIEKEDQGRAEYLRKYFNQDIRNPLLYDLVLNTDTISYDEVAQIISDMVVRRREILSVLYKK